MLLPEVSNFLNVGRVTIYRPLTRRQVSASRLADSRCFNIDSLTL
jgi:hypothetical protein